MLKVLIVEDEILTRIGLESMLSWEQHGFTVVGIAENGQQGLDMALSLLPDIIITDIIMPKLNGIELIRAVKHAGLDPKVIILSAYDEFSYVKEALKLGACDYILKLDIEPEVLVQTLTKVKEAIPHAERHEAPMVSWREKADCIHRILKGESAEPLLDGCSLDIPERNLLCIFSKDQMSPNELLQIEFYPNIKTIICTLNEVISQFGKTYGCSVKNQYFFHILSTEVSYNTMELKEFSCRVQRLLHDYFIKSYNIGLSVEISQMTQSFRELSQQFISMVTDTQEVITAQEVISELDEFPKILSEQDLGSLTRFFERLYIQLSECSTHQLYHVCYTLTNMVDTLLPKSLIASSGWDTPERIRYLSHSCRAPKDFSEYLKGFEDHVRGLFEFHVEGNQVALRVKQYIDTCYGSSEITLYQLATMVNVSPNYLCRICRRELGSSPMQYLTRVRVRNAKYLLTHSERQIKDISHAVGFHNPYYFSRIFKKATGITPGEYRKR